MNVDAGTMAPTEYASHSFLSRGLVLGAGVKYWNKHGGKCLCEERGKERLFSFLGILGSEWRKFRIGPLDLTLACSNTFHLPRVRWGVIRKLLTGGG